jgi:hypothetical protein
MLPGPVDVFVDGLLDVSTPWAGSAGGNTIEVDMGVEDRLRLARNVRYTEETAGLLGNHRRLHTHIEVEIASGMSTTTEVTLYDRIPIAGSDDVTVEATKAEPPTKPYAGEPDGMLLESAVKQRLSVPAGNSARASLSFDLVMKKKTSIEGGDRRG